MASDRRSASTYSHTAATMEAALGEDSASLYEPRLFEAELADDIVKEKKEEATVRRHEVKVRVLGLAGITVDRSHCRDVSNNANAPAPPESMQAVVTFMRNSHVRGTTTLSAPLQKSQAEVIEEAEVDNNSRERHVALWSTSQSPLGNTVTFETKLECLGGTNSSPSRSERKSFELVVGLVDDSSLDSHKVACPIGVANLVVTAEQSKGNAIFDLPVYSLPDCGGVDAFHPIPLHAPPTESQSGKSNEKAVKKKGTLSRLFSKRSRGAVEEEKKSEELSSLNMKGLLGDSVYAIHSGDAALRVEVEVKEKEFNVEVNLEEQQSDNEAVASSNENATPWIEEVQSSIKSASASLPPAVEATEKDIQSLESGVDDTITTTVAPPPFIKKTETMKSEPQEIAFDESIERVLSCDSEEVNENPPATLRRSASRKSAATTPASKKDSAKSAISKIAVAKAPLQKKKAIVETQPIQKKTAASPKSAQKGKTTATAAAAAEKKSTQKTKNTKAEKSSAQTKDDGAKKPPVQTTSTVAKALEKNPKTVAGPKKASKNEEEMSYIAIKGVSQDNDGNQSASTAQSIAPSATERAFDQTASDAPVEVSAPRSLLESRQWNEPVKPTESSEKRKTKREVKTSSTVAKSAAYTARANRIAATPRKKVEAKEMAKAASSRRSSTRAGKLASVKESSALKAVPSQTKKDALKEVVAPKKDAPKAVAAPKKEASKALPVPKKKAPKAAPASKKEVPKAAPASKKEVPKAAPASKKEVPKEASEAKKDVSKEVLVAKKDALKAVLAPDEKKVTNDAPAQKKYARVEKVTPIEKGSAEDALAGGSTRFAKVSTSALGGDKDTTTEKIEVTEESIQGEPAKEAVAAESQKLSTTLDSSIWEGVDTSAEKIELADQPFQIGTTEDLFKDENGNTLFEAELLEESMKSIDSEEKECEKVEEMLLYPPRAGQTSRYEPRSNEPSIQEMPPPQKFGMSRSKSDKRRVLGFCQMPACGSVDIVDPNSVVSTEASSKAPPKTAGTGLFCHALRDGVDLLRDEDWTKFDDEESWQSMTTRETKRDEEVTVVPKPADVFYREMMCANPAESRAAARELFQDMRAELQEGTLCRAPSSGSVETDALTRRKTKWEKNRALRAKAFIADGSFFEESLRSSLIDEASDEDTVETADDTVQDSIQKSDSQEGDGRNVVIDEDGSSRVEVVSPGQSKAASEATAVVVNRGVVRGLAPETAPLEAESIDYEEDKILGTPADSRNALRSGVSKEDSPKGVDELNMEGGSKSDTFSNKLLSILTCRTHVDNEPRSVVSEVPALLVGLDEGSVGELTATTYERQVDIQRHREKVERARKAAEARRSREARTFECFPCGPIGRTDSLDAESVREKDNYFSEYDDYSILSPEMTAAAEAAWARRKAEINASRGGKRSPVRPRPTDESLSTVDSEAGTEGKLVERFEV